jgi:hypothetical protein
MGLVQDRAPIRTHPSRNHHSFPDTSLSLLNFRRYSISLPHSPTPVPGAAAGQLLALMLLFNAFLWTTWDGSGRFIPHHRHREARNLIIIPFLPAATHPSRHPLLILLAGCNSSSVHVSTLVSHAECSAILLNR